MIRKLVVTAGLAALLAAAVGGGAFASASGSDGMPRTITVIGKQVSGQFADIGKKGPSAGDEFILMNQFWSADQSHRIGNVRVICTLLGSHDEPAHCVATATLLGGTIEVSGLSPSNGNDFSLAITGGTGNFNHAEGFVMIHNLTQTTERDTIVLVG
jgi:hypothetical protein